MEEHSTVKVRIYDLSQGLAKNLSRMLIGKQIDGIWHTGVVVFGKEYFYGGGIQAKPLDFVSVFLVLVYKKFWNVSIRN